MPRKLPRVTARQIITILEKVGFVFSRQSGSHKIYKNSDGKRVTVPFHGGKILHPKILKSIIRDAEINLKDFKELN
ncbi:type II toxin-antitoxin system HicA family toxin [bacterium]|nr:MAG: type II toxin-antitoxin system HicA family toxin [bacterium]